jgi:hypothetical protein
MGVPGSAKLEAAGRTSCGPSSPAGMARGESADEAKLWASGGRFLFECMTSGLVGVLVGVGRWFVL